MFIMNSASEFYLPPFSSSVASEDDKNENCSRNTQISFQELHRNKWNSAVPDVQLCYATRTNDNCDWIDTELAQKLLHTFSLYPEVFDLKYKLPQIHSLLIYSFVLGIGLQHQFPVFKQYIEFLMQRIPSDRGIDDINYQSFICYMSGIIKVYLCTETTHQSHFYLLQHANAYHQVIISHLKQQLQIGQTMNEFDSSFSNNPYNFAHIILEKFSTIESLMIKYSQKIQHELLKLYLYQSTQVEKVSSHLLSSNSTDSNLLLSNNHEQIKLQLYQFVLDIKMKQRRGVKVYQTLWRSLSSEGGPWCPHGYTPIVHWKLEQNQPISMIRRRFVINYEYNDHKDASLLRDTGKVEDAQNLYNEHLKRIRMSEFTGSQSLITIGVDRDEEIMYDICEQTVSNSDEIMMPIISFANDDIILKADTNRITMKKVYKGMLLLTNSFLTFNGSDYAKKSVSIPLSSITHIFTRRYLLMDTAIEVFTSFQKTFMFDFPAGQRQKILNEIAKFELSNLVFLQTCDEDAQPLLEEIMNKWQAGEISNFDYLMKLNLLAGRTYNDLSQYPVFPWVISDYKSKQLNLDDPDVYRNLSSPIGALNKNRLQKLLNKRVANVDELDYLYGSFYSSPAFVIGYLIRVEPFTSLHIELQAGKFDVSNRLFNSIPKAWESVSEATMDFRELIPEFFYMPEFLINSNHFDLGASSTGDVELPPWASSARDFITKNRAALESKYVSSMLPRWIDLIFGVLSRGQESINANNKFSPYFYETSITPEVLQDPKRLKFIQEFAVCFGQAPKQLFFEPHIPKKFDLMRPPVSAFGHRYCVLFDVKNPILSLEIVNSKKPKIAKFFQSNQASEGNSPNYIKIIDSKFEAYSYGMPDKLTSKVQLILNSTIKNENIKLMTNTVHTKNGCAYSAVPWDNAITISTLMSGSPLHIKRSHTKRITSIAVSDGFYATASLDCTVILWRNFPYVPQIPMSIMTKHSNCIDCVSINENIDLCVSVSRNGDIITQSVISGNFIRKVNVELDSDSKYQSKMFLLSSSSSTNNVSIDDNNININDSSDERISISSCRSFSISNINEWNSFVVTEPAKIMIFDSGTICVGFTQSDRETVYVFDQNLEEINHIQLENPIRCWMALDWPDENDYLFTALKSGGLAIYKLPNFEIIWYENKVDFVVTRLAVVKNPLQIIFGTMEGKVISLPFQ